ncbi:hypothetical protein FPQ18DRAFT_309518 [Pyronema domesticum]|nr:hypothetical protein FPQ18DRAFT_309518 [Pyronema domesticum]
MVFAVNSTIQSIFLFRYSMIRHFIPQQNADIKIQEHQEHSHVTRIEYRRWFIQTIPPVHLQIWSHRDKHPPPLPLLAVTLRSLQTTLIGLANRLRLQSDIGDSPKSATKDHLLDTDIVKTKRPPSESETQASRQTKMIKYEPYEKVELSLVLPSSEAIESLDTNHPVPAYLPPENAEKIAYNSWCAIYGTLTENNNKVWFNCNISDECNWSSAQRCTITVHLKTNYGLEKSNYELHCLEILRRYGTTELTGDTYANKINEWTCGSFQRVIPIRVTGRRKAKFGNMVTLVTGLMRATEHLHVTHQVVISIRDIFPEGWSKQVK